MRKTEALEAAMKAAQRRRDRARYAPQGRFATASTAVECLP
ncbi:MAG: hypothetical protein QGH76_01625 [Phycisphaerales bacterium]|nr:hypothetical protein [Phycisphaerales bacterium]